MDNLLDLSKMNEKYQALKATFSRDDIAYIANKDTGRGKLIGFLTFDYYRRESLIKEGNIVFGYVIKTYKQEDNPLKNYASWLLFSPSKVVNDHPEIYLKIVENLELLKTKKHLDKFERPIKVALLGELSEPKYLEIPAPYNEGHLVYLQYCEVKPHQTPNLNLGLNFLIIAPAISKEVIYLPERYLHDVFHL